MLGRQPYVLYTERPEKLTPDKTSPGKRKLAGETTETVHKQWKKSTFARTRKPKNPSVEPVLRQKRKELKRRTDKTTVCN